MTLRSPSSNGTSMNPARRPAGAPNGAVSVRANSLMAIKTASSAEVARRPLWTCRRYCSCWTGVGL